MSLFIVEAAAAGAKEALKLGVVWLVFSSLLSSSAERGALKYFYLGMAVASLAVLSSFFISPGMEVKAALSKLTGYVFFLFFMSSLAVLFSGRFFGRLAGKKALGPLTALLTVVYFSPDIIGSSMFVRELSLMREAYLRVYLSAAAGFFLPLLGLYFAVRGRRLPIRKFFEAGQFLLFLALVKLLAGGAGGFAELSLIPAVQRGVMKFVHDFVHQSFVMFMVPDHPLLRLTVWNFVAIFFGPNFAVSIALILILLPPAAYLYRSFTAPIEAPDDEATTGAGRRKFRAAVGAERRRKAAPVAAFMLVVAALWFSGLGERASALYVPAPKPVVEDKGMVVIPLSDPTMDLMDGRLHKFSLFKDGETIGLLVIRKPDGRLSVCLDACEICPPEGYGLSEDNVVCIYCLTPIPVHTLGRSGGCNPIPLEALITERDIRIDAGEISLKWKDVITGKTKEGIK